MNDSSLGSTIAAERTRWCAGSTPGGVIPSSRSASTARQQLLPGLDDAAVGGNQPLLGAVDDRAHALLQRRVLHRDALHAGVGVAALLGLAVDQVVVVLVLQRPVGAGDVLAVHAVAVLHRLHLGCGQRADRVVVERVRPAVLVVDRDPEVAVHRVVAARRHHREAGITHGVIRQ